MLGPAPVLRCRAHRLVELSSRREKRGEKRKKTAVPAEQKDTLELLRILAAQADGAVGAKAVEAAASHGISIGSVDVTDKARLRSGNLVSTAWKEEMNPPQTDSTVAISSLRAGGESRVTAGNTYAEKESFWN
ncbi:hypothetical protein QC761_704007 [Podospora bellae-mahoneyi]|uniref:Uncharacterized protein n=1 Tax=Podospora bellae-mahoneyi TaxID=2093777 RepID=A0ABR0F6W2_9PEZI|nr:hypothetical protein QC761_704007 [Podospora bellae-mahoneyi]